MSATFVRQLGFQSGVQLNALQDNSDAPSADFSDQVFGIVMRATRGRIDRPFKVNRNNFTKKLGRGESIRASALNEAHIHVFEALNNGAYEAVVQRLSTPSAALSYISISVGSGAILTATVAAGVITAIAVTNGGAGYLTAPTIKITSTGAGVGATATATIAAGAITSVAVNTGGTGYVAGVTTSVVAVANIEAAVSATIPVTPYMLTIQHLECFNDGLSVELHADQKLSAGLPVANSLINLKLRDANGVLQYEFDGSLVALTDDQSQSQLITDVVERNTTNVVVTVGAQTSVPVNSNAYGRDANNNNLVAVTPIMNYFTEGGFGYTTADYVRCVNLLKNTDLNYGYIASGGTQAAALISNLVQLAKDTNTQFRFDLDGSLSPAAAITQLSQYSIDSHYVHAYWSPLRSNDPLGLNGKVLLGTSTLNIALACLRNSQTNAKGFAPKNTPIAGKNFPLNRTGIVQTYNPTEQELSDLAANKINAVIFQSYNGGGKYVFNDSLTCAQVSASFKKLISVAEMSSSIDNIVTMFGKEVLQLPMQTAIKKTNDFLKALFEGAQSSGWIVPSDALGGLAFQYSVVPNAARPVDRMDVSYTLRYDGTVRQIVVSQTLSK